MHVQYFGILAAILHLGNVEVTLKSRRDDNAGIADDDSHALTCARLLGVDCGLMNKWIIHRKIQTGKEVMREPF